MPVNDLITVKQTEEAEWKAPAVTGGTILNEEVREVFLKTWHLSRD